jgi:hypothetical protein
MTRDEAYKLLIQGDAITHKHLYMYSYEFLTYDEKGIVADDGTQFEDFFWNDVLFENGWEVFS